MTLFSVPRTFIRTIRLHSFWRVFNLHSIKARNCYFVFTSIRNMSDDKPFERLPTNVLPRNYQISLHPNLTEFTFAGKEVIQLEVKEETSEVVLNCVDIVISAACFSVGDTEHNTSDIAYSKEDETVTLTFPSSLPLGNCNLSLEFTGELNDKMKGFYRSKYTDSDGNDNHCAVTQFEPTDARRAFPCWDEPAHKATFDITLIVPKDRVALSNTNIIEEKDYKGDPTHKVVKYARSPIMSSYLVAFVVGEFDYVEDKDANGVTVRVYTPKGKAHQGKFALEVSVKTLPFYKDYFGIPYPLPKMDLIAIPDFAAGAMENWGLVTYRETALLVDPENSSSVTKQWVALVVGHELAHQWFGNLVTMEWWTHLWLNEGFASWIEYLSVDHCFPEYDIWTQFVTSDFARAMELDALKSSHPIEVPVGHPSEIDQIFDAISYSKGASVIRMLHEYLGDEDFKTGLNHYLSKFKYGNASTEDLWAYLASASSKPVADVMNTWTKQMGFPVLSVTAEQKDDCRELKISQKRFLADGDSDASCLWKVPVSVSTTESPQRSVAKTLLDQEKSSLLISGVQPHHWVKLNPGQVGVYRVHYSTEMLEQLLPAVKDNTLPPRDRLGLQNDLFALCRAGLASAADVLQAVEAYVNEENYTVWNDLSVNMSAMSILLQYTDYHNSFQAFCADLFKPVANKLGWDSKEGEGHLVALLRGLVLGRLGKSGHPETVAEAQKRFAAHYTGENVLPADLRSAVYSTVLKAGDQTTLDAALKLLRDADLHEERVRLMRCMGSVTKPELINQVLNFSLSDEVRSMDTVFVVASVTGSVTGRHLAWQFLQDNFEEFNTRYEGGFLISRLVKTTTEHFASEDKSNEIEAFFTEHSLPAAERTIQQSLENVRLNARWLAREAENVKAWLHSKGY